jgi:uncharacterized protein
MKIILDSNVIIAAFSSRGLYQSLFELCLDRHDIIISDHIPAKISSILHKKFKMPREKVEAIINYLNEFCECVNYIKLENAVCRDKDDDEILALSQSTNADYIINGHDYKGCKHCLDHLSSEHSGAKPLFVVAYIRLVQLLLLDFS